jgi:RNA polymerase sigma-70 factor, ECF subfamily
VSYQRKSGRRDFIFSIALPIQSSGSAKRYVFSARGSLAIAGKNLRLLTGLVAIATKQQTDVTKLSAQTSLMVTLMETAIPPTDASPDRASDSLSEPSDVLLDRARGGDDAAFEQLMRRYNQRLYRVARSVVQDGAEAEDVVQQAFVSAFVNAEQFAGRSGVTAWLTRITLNEALGRMRHKKRAVADPALDPDWRNGGLMPRDPEDQVSRRELVSLLEAAIDRLPESYRVVYILRDVEDLEGNEVAECLGITPESVRVRLHRARSILRDGLYSLAGSRARDVFSFAGERCDRIVNGVLSRTRDLRT